MDRQMITLARQIVSIELTYASKRSAGCPKNKVGETNVGGRNRHKYLLPDADDNEDCLQALADGFK